MLRAQAARQTINCSLRPLNRSHLRRNSSAISRLRAPPLSDASRSRPDFSAIEPAMRPPCALASSGTKSFNSFAPPRFIQHNWCSLLTKTRLPLTVCPHPHLQLAILMVPSRHTEHTCDSETEVWRDRLHRPSRFIRLFDPNGCRWIWRRLNSKYPNSGDTTTKG